MDDALLVAIRERAADPARATDDGDAAHQRLVAPATDIELAEAERELGFALPTDLALLYRQVGNGGFGPGYGLLGVASGATDDLRRNAVQLYRWLREPAGSDPRWSWPQRLLPIAHLGCGMYACVDCSVPEGPIIWFEPNPHCAGEPWDDAFIPLCSSLVEWLTSWLAGQDLMQRAWTARFGDVDGDAG